MRVLHVNSEMTWRGGEQQMISLIEILKLHKIESWIFCRSGSEVEKYARENGLKYMSSSFRGLKILDGLKLKKFASQVDIIHTHTANAHTVAYYASVLGLRKPVVVSKRTDFPVKTKSKFSHPNIKKVLCVSNKIKEITQKDLNNPDKVFTVYSGIDIERFEGEQNSLKDLLSLKESDVLIGNCSALAPHKDYFTFIDVAKKLPQYHFVIIGDGPLELELKQYAKGLENIHFTGFLKDIQHYLKSLDLFLITSETEGLGTSILDAMICKLPVVATKAGGIPEIVIPGKTGLLASVRGVDELAANIEQVLSDKDLSQKMVEQAFSNVSQNFSRQATAENTLKHYQEILK